MLTDNISNKNRNNTITHKRGRNYEYEGILNDILDGKYDVTSVIKEKNMIAKYQVSKTPVREARVQLCSESILVNIPRYGYKLVAITPQQILEVIELKTKIWKGQSICWRWI